MASAEEERRRTMCANKTDQGTPGDKKTGTRKLFYGSIGLLLGGLLILAIGAIYGLPLVMLVGTAGFLGGGVVQLIWLVRRLA
jgi:hypothetical protein